MGHRVYNFKSLSISELTQLLLDNIFDGSESTEYRNKTTNMYSLMSRQELLEKADKLFNNELYKEDTIKTSTIELKRRAIQEEKCVTRARDVKHPTYNKSILPTIRIDDNYMETILEGMQCVDRVAIICEGHISVKTTDRNRIRRKIKKEGYKGEVHFG
jgi:hypothetical protein